MRGFTVQFSMIGSRCFAKKLERDTKTFEKAKCKKIINILAIAFFGFNDFQFSFKAVA